MYAALAIAGLGVAFMHVTTELWRYYVGLHAGSIASCWPWH